MTESMTCGGIDPGNTFLWLGIGGILLGGGLSFIIAPRRRRLPAVFLSLLSLSILSLLIAFYISGFSLEGVEFRLLWTAAFSAVGYAGFLFWKAVGIPLSFLVIVLTFSLWYVFYDWSCAVPGKVICSFSAISEGDDYIRIHYEEPGSEGVIERLDKEDIYPEMRQIFIPEYFFLLRFESAYIFGGFSNSPDGQPSDTGFGKMIEDLLMRLPGFRISERMNVLEISPSVEYILLLRESGIPELMRKIE